MGAGSAGSVTRRASGSCGDLLRLQAIDRELVAVEIAGIGAIGVGMPGPRTDRTLILTAGGECRLVEGSDRGPVWRHKADGTAIGECCGLAVGRLQDEKLGSRFAPGRTAVAKITDALVPERPEHAVIERARLCDVVRAECDVCEYRHSFLL